MTAETDVAEKPRAEPWSPPLIDDPDTGEKRLATQADVDLLVSVGRAVRTIGFYAQRIVDAGTVIATHAARQ